MKQRARVLARCVDDLDLHALALLARHRSTERHDARLSPANAHARWWGCADGEANLCDEREYGLGIKADERLVYAYAVPEDRYHNGGQVTCMTQPETVQYGRWHHLGAVISSKGRAIRIFIDGAPMATCPLSEAGLRHTSHQLHIATNWIGMIDDLRLYLRELSDADIAALAHVD